MCNTRDVLWSCFLNKDMVTKDLFWFMNLLIWNIWRYEMKSQVINTFTKLLLLKKCKMICSRNSGPWRCNLIEWLWGLKEIIYMRADAALQVLGIICSCQVIQLMGYDFQLTYIIILVMCFFHYTWSLIENGLNILVLSFCHPIPPGSLLRISRVCK